MVARFEKAWEKVAGLKGGFLSPEKEQETKQKGKDMLVGVFNNPGPLKRLSVKIKEDLPHYYLSEIDNIILCGKVDWLEYLPDTDSVHIIDFKTNKSKQEDPNSLQLPIYLLLVMNTQKRKVQKASYWYLGLPDGMVEKELPDPGEAHEKVLKIAKEIQLAKKLQRLVCKDNGCRHCEPFERIIKGDAQFVGENDFRQDLYIFGSHQSDDEDDSIIL